MSGSEPKVVLYGRPDCHLCDDARVVLERVRSRISFELIERDIEADEELLQRYLERIPVVAIDDREVFDYFVDEPQFERLLEIASESS